MRYFVIRTTSAISGAEVYTKWLLDGLRTYTGADVELITDHSPFAAAVRADGVPVHRFPLHVPEIGTKRSLVYGLLTGIPFGLWVTALLLISGRSRQLVILESMTEKLLLTRLLRHVGYRVVWIEHGPLFRTNRWGKIKQWYRSVSSMANGILAVSEDTKVDLLTGGVSLPTLAAIPIGVEEDSIAQRVHRQDKPVVGFLGGVNEAKGIRVFLKMAKQLSLGNPRLRFRVIGDGPLFGWMCSELDALGLTDRFTLVPSPSSYIGEIDKCSILVMPTLHQEGLSIALMQAMARHRAVVTRDIGGNRELVDGKTGILMPLTSDAGQFAGTVARLLADPDGMQRLGKTAGDRIRKRFALKRQAISIADYFRTV